MNERVRTAVMAAWGSDGARLRHWGLSEGGERLGSRGGRNSNKTRWEKRSCEKRWWSQRQKMVLAFACVAILGWKHRGFGAVPVAGER